MRMYCFRHLACIGFALLVSVGCSTSNSGSSLESALSVNNSAQLKSAPASVEQANYQETVLASQFSPSQGFTENASYDQQNAASDGYILQSEPAPIVSYTPRRSKTFLINGLGSSIASIGYGFTNLSKKIPNSKLYNYASPLESSLVIRRSVTNQIKKLYAQDPNIEINLIGISYGANIVTHIAGRLGRIGIPVNYLVTMDGPAMIPIQSNVVKVDNFTCNRMTCFKTKSRLKLNNSTTKYSNFVMPTRHIPLANHAKVHARILAQIDANNRPPMLVSSQTQ